MQDYRFGEEIHSPNYDQREDSIDIAIVGLGWFAREKVLPAIESSHLCEVGVVVSSNATKAAKIAERYNASSRLTYDELSNGVNAEHYDAVYIGTPNATHLNFTQAAASLGKHVICEKPMEVSADRARRMVEICNEAGVTLMIAYRLQGDPLIRRLKKQIENGIIGRPVQIFGAMTTTLTHAFEDPDHWRYDADMAGGGALIDVGVYPLNTTRFLLGTDPISVQASTKSVQEPFEEIDEHISFMLDFPEEPMASFVASLNAYKTSTLSIVGTEGRILLDPGLRYQPVIKIETDSSCSTFTPERQPTVQVAAEFDYFADCIFTDTTPSADGLDGLTDMQIMDTAYKSAETGSRMDLKYADL